MRYLIQYKEIMDLSINEFLVLVEENEKIRLADLKVKDLIYCDGCSIFPGNGIYFFYHKDQCMYVGKCSSRSFVERIPSHFDLRNEAWMNTLLKKVSKFFNIGLEKAAKKVFFEHSLILINFEGKNNKEIINKTESLFRKILKPKLNSYKRDYEFELERRIKDSYL